MSNIIDDVLEWSPRLALSGMMEKQQNVVNATGQNDVPSQASKSSPEHTATPDGDVANATEQYHTEVIENIEDGGQDT